MRSLLARIASLSPLGPIFGKELRVTARRKRTYVLRFVYLGLLLLGLLFCYLILREEMSHNRGVAQRAQDLAIMGMVFFSVFSFFTLVAMALVGPVLTASAVNSERLHKTLGVLLMTPINAWQIASGKLFSRLLIALTLIGLSLPVLAVVRLLGGVELSQMFGSICLCASTALFTATIGLFYSTLLSRAYAVILLAYATLAMLWGIIPMIVGVFVSEVLEIRDRQVEEMLLKWFAVSNPFMQMGLTIFQESPMRMVSIPGWPWHVLVYTGLSALLLLWTAAILRKRARRELEGTSPALTPAPLAPMAWAPVAPPMVGGDGALPPPLPVMPYAAPPVMGGGAKPPREVSDNPVLWRETRRPLFPKLWQKITALVVCIGLLMVFYGLMAASNSMHQDEPHMTLAVSFWVVLTLVSAVLSASAIAQEKESDTWTLLLATPISGMGIVWGKFVGLLRRMMWPAVLVILHYVFFTLTGLLHPVTAFVCIWLTLSSCVLWLATGVYWSLRLKNTTFAVILNLLCPLLLYGIIPLLVAIGGELTRDSWRDDNYRYTNPAEATLFANPMLYMVQCIDDFRVRYDFDGYRHRMVRFYMGTEWTAEDFAWLSFAVGLLYILAGALVAYGTAVRLDRIVGRAAQIDRLPAAAPLQRPA